MASQPTLPTKEYPLAPKTIIFIICSIIPIIISTILFVFTLFSGMALRDEFEVSNLAGIYFLFLMLISFYLPLLIFEFIAKLLLKKIW